MNISDIIYKIISYLSTKNKLNLLSISKFHYNLTLIFDDEPVHLDRIIGLSRFNKFTNIIINGMIKMLAIVPSSVKHLIFTDNFTEDF